jgi:hypothetical protein
VPAQTCNVIKYVPHHAIEDHLRLGWMLLRDRLSHHSDYNVLMGWPCRCPIAFQQHYAVGAGAARCAGASAVNM